jgi:Protein of unknown function (DUF2950)
MHTMKTNLPLICLAVSLPWTAAVAEGERAFANPDDALKALVAASTARDTNALSALFGPGLHALISPDLSEASAERELYIQRLTNHAAIAGKTSDRARIELGADAWPFPIPLVRTGGQWHFDTAAGREEILNRRIGRNELNAIEVCRAYVVAQREYATSDRDGDDVVEYALHLRSSPARHDGLYWPTHAGEEPSPLGPLISESNPVLGATRPPPYKGYDFKILTAQGPHAAGGAHSFLINGHMVAGFGLVAWPAQWGVTGTMTFIVNQQGKVHERNLGAQTAKIASAMTTYDPGAGWKPVKSP